MSCQSVGCLVLLSSAISFSTILDFLEVRLNGFNLVQSQERLNQACPFTGVLREHT